MPSGTPEDPNTTPGDPSAQNPDGTDPAPGDPTLDITDDPALAEPIPAESAGPLVVRRLSPREYSNTLRDLLGENDDPGAQLPDEANRASGFAVVESASTVSVRLFMETAERLASDAQLDTACQGGVEEACAAAFIDDFGRRAFRRPVKASERENLLVLFDRARALEFSVDEALRHVASAMLQSSGFLYLWEIGDEAPATDAGLVALTQHQIASRLSYLIWGTMPDAELSAAADAGQLTTPEQIRAQAARLLADTDQARETLRDFHVQWLHIENLGDLVKDPTLYPNFSDDVRAALAPELERFVSNVILEGDGTSRALFTATHTFANSELSGVYGVSASGNELEQVQLDPAQRAGVLTQLAFLATNANTTGSNPPRRGKVVWEQVLCGDVPPPPANVPPVEPPAENLTTRQRFEAHSENACAAACHGILDPVGFAFEHYDAIGAYRATENGIEVDASGTMTTPAGGRIEFTTAVELMSRLAESYEVDRCLAQNWFRFMLNRREGVEDMGSIETAYRAAGAGPATDFSIRDFITQMVQTSAFRYRSLGDGETL